MNRRQCKHDFSLAFPLADRLIAGIRTSQQSRYGRFVGILDATNKAKRLLDHLKEAMFYSQKDLEALSRNLADCQRYVEHGREEYSPHLLTLLDARIKVCKETLADLELNLSQLTPELTPKWEKLVSILRSLAGCNARSKVRQRQGHHDHHTNPRQFPNDEVDAYNEELLKLQEELKADGILAYEATGSTEEKLAEMVDKMQFTAAHPEPAPAPENLIGTLLRRNLLWITLIKSKSVSLYYCRYFLLTHA